MTASSPIRLLAAASLLCLTAFGALPAPAADKTDSPDAKLDYAAIESIGLPLKQAEGGLEKSLWRGSTRSEVIQLLDAMPATSPDPAIQNLIFGVLLSQTSAGDLKNDVKPEPGRDLLTLRLGKLLEGGAYKRAFDLYSKLEAEPYHENLARNGILAMLFNGEKSLACLEGNSVGERFPESSFLKSFGAYCDATLAGSAPDDSLTQLKDSPFKLLETLVSKPDFKFAYSPAAFDALSPLERAVLTAENRLDVSGLDPATVPPAHLQILLRNEALSDDARFNLTVQAVARGLTPVEALTKIYEPTTGEKHEVAEPAPTGPLPEDDAGRLSVLYKRAIAAAGGEERWQVIRQALPLAHRLGPAVMAPFAGFLREYSPETASAEEIRDVLQALTVGGLNVPQSWVKLTLKISSQDIDNNEYSRILASALLTRPDEQTQKELRERLVGSLKAADSKTNELVYNIIENIDFQSADSNNANDAYEKEYYLTFSGDYVMPSVLVWDRVKEASQAKATGETILLGTVLLSDRPIQDSYPGVLRDILQGFDKVGLTKVSQDLAAAACLGNTN